MSSRPTLYKGKSGQWAFVLHRITGFGVFFFLLLHIVDVALVSNARRYNEVHALYGNIVLRVFECGLLLGLLYHALNGLRIIAIDVTDTNYGFVARRWHNPLWRLFDWSLLTLALLHGLNGIRYILDDYVRRPATRAVSKATLYTATFALFFYGTLTIVTFSPR